MAVIWTSYGSADALVVSASLSAIASGAYVMGGNINNSVQRNLYMDIELKLSSAVTAGSGQPSVILYLLPSADGGVTYPNPPGSTAGAAPASYYVGSINAVASSAFTSGLLRGVLLPPGYFRILLRNSLGVAFPTSTSSTLSGYRYSEAVI